jgi:hypothetical protein
VGVANPELSPLYHHPNFNALSERFTTSRLTDPLIPLAKRSKVPKSKSAKKRDLRFSLQQQMPRLRAMNARGQLALFVGAGISFGCGLPDWKELLRCLKRRLVDVAASDSPGNDVAELARQAFGVDFNKEVAGCLYRNGVTISPAVEAIVKSEIKRIVCFNFDDILEETFSAETMEHKVVLNGEKFNIHYPDAIIFHPHGYLDRSATEDEYRQSEIVLSESDYQSLYNRHYCVTNLIQLSILINFSVLFVGMSLTDPNTNRLLSSCREVGVRHWHYALLRVRKEDQKVKAKDLMKMGVIPIWIDQYSDIPGVLRRIGVAATPR